MILRPQIVVLPTTATVTNPIPDLHPTAFSALAIVDCSKPFDTDALTKGIFPAGRPKSVPERRGQQRPVRQRARQRQREQALPAPGRGPAQGQRTPSTAARVAAGPDRDLRYPPNRRPPPGRRSVGAFDDEPAGLQCGYARGHRGA